MAHKLTTWLWAQTLPFWAEHGVDHEAGGFHERINAAQEPVTGDGKRAMVQARQIFVFSQPPPITGVADSTALAENGMAFLTRHCRHPDGGWRFRVARDGQPRDDTRDLYTHAFILFALASRHRADGGEAKALSAETMAFLDSAFNHPAGGYHEALDSAGNPAPGARRQNPHMHLLEAFLEWFDASGDEIWLNRARGIAALLRDRFVVEGTLREHLTQFLTPASGAAGRRIEPGHHFEWVWLLRRYETLGGGGSLAELAATLYQFAIAHGIDGETGGVIDTVDSDGALVDGSRRLWPQTEAIKAHIAQAGTAMNPIAAQRVEAQVDALFTAHLDGAAPGAWREHIAPDGTALVTAYPASSLYHLTLAAAELERWRMAES